MNARRCCVVCCSCFTASQPPAHNSQQDNGTKDRSLTAGNALDNFMDSQSIKAAARASIAEQQKRMDLRIDAEVSLERGRQNLVSAVLELSRIDDEKLTETALAEAKSIRQLKSHHASYGEKGPAYKDASLAAKYFQGSPQRRFLGTMAIATLEAASSPSTPMLRGPTVIVPRRHEPYWRHLAPARPAPPPEGPEDPEAVDESRDAMTEVAELRTSMDDVPDPNAQCLRIARQFLRLVYAKKVI